MIRPIRNEHPKQTLTRQMIQDLKSLKWTETEINAYLIAQQSHGSLRPGLRDWEYRSAHRRWIKEKPVSLPWDPQF